MSSRREMLDVQIEHMNGLKTLIYNMYKIMCEDDGRQGYKTVFFG